MIRDRRAILALLTALNFLNYIDRAVIAAVLNPMKAELGLSYIEAGALSSAFLIGFFATAPWFGSRADKGARKGLITLGVIVWSLATIASGMADNFTQLLCARIVVGVGEASFTTLAPTIIDDVTPPARKGRALAIFFVAIPAGYALGYILGGMFAGHWGWRSAFYLTGGPGVIIALSCLAMAEPQRKLVDAKAKLIEGLREIAKSPLFRRTTLGYCAWTAAAGAFSHWAPNFLVERYPGELNNEDASKWFGIVLLTAGLIGTFSGGLWLDRRARQLPVAPAGAPFDAPEHKRHINAALRVCSIGVLIAAPLTALAFLAPLPPAFFVFALVAQIGLFMSTSPVSMAGLRSVPEERRASGVAATIFSIHLFGDLWSATLLGVLLEILPRTLAMMALPLTFALAGYIWWPRAREAATPSRGSAGDLPAARIHSGP